MSKYLSLFILLLLALIPVHAQDCDIDLSQVLVLLGQAQAKLNAGNNDAALALLSSARVIMQEMEAACGVDVGEIKPAIAIPDEAGAADAMMLNGRIVMFIDRGTSATAFDRLDGLAFANGFDLTIYTDADTASHNEFATDLTTEDVIGAVYSEREADPDTLQALADFMSGGGKAIIFYERAWVEDEINRLVRDLFGVAVVDEVILETENTLIYPETTIPDWAPGLEFGVYDDYHAFYPEFNAYLMTPLEGSASGYIVSAETGGERLTYFRSEDGSVTFLPNIVRDGSLYYFFEDDYIENFDNEAAMIGMLTALLSR